MDDSAAIDDDDDDCSDGTAVEALEWLVCSAQTNHTPQCSLSTNKLGFGCWTSVSSEVPVERMGSGVLRSGLFGCGFDFLFRFPQHSMHIVLSR